MSKPIWLIFLTAVLLIGVGNLSAADLKDGFFDLRWRINLAQIDGFRKIAEKSNVTYFASRARVYKIGNIKVSDAVYGTFENQFFAVYIKIDAIDVFARLKRHINHKYGLPQIKMIEMTGPDRQTVYQWKHQQTKIKLKIYENRNNMKMAFYYTPLSARVNEAQLEAFEATYKKPIFPLDKTQRKQAEELWDLMKF
jgi:hypothetical protein